MRDSRRVVFHGCHPGRPARSALADRVRPIREPSGHLLLGLGPGSSPCSLLAQAAALGRDDDYTHRRASVVYAYDSFDIVSSRSFVTVVTSAGTATFDI